MKFLYAPYLTSILALSSLPVVLVQEFSDIGSNDVFDDRNKHQSLYMTTDYFGREGRHQRYKKKSSDYDHAYQNYKQDRSGYDYDYEDDYYAPHYTKADNRRYDSYHTSEDTILVSK